MEPNNGLAHLAHHDVHWELCYNYQGRADDIRANKPAGEQAIRLKFFQLLPAHYLPEQLQEATASCRKADAAWRQAYAAWLSSPDGLRTLAQAHAELFPDCPWDEAQQTMFPKTEAR